MFIMYPFRNTFKKKYELNFFVKNLYELMYPL